jgi:hypothetical protein
MKKTLGMLAVGLMLSGVVNTASAVTIRGASSCGDWVQEQNKNSDWNTNHTWLIGYLTGIAIGTNKDFLKGTDNPSIYLWMDNYCRQNPLKDMADGGLDLFFELKKQKNIK